MLLGEERIRWVWSCKGGCGRQLQQTIVRSYMTRWRWQQQNVTARKKRGPLATAKPQAAKSDHFLLPVALALLLAGVLIVVRGHRVGWLVVRAHNLLLLVLRLVI